MSQTPGIGSSREDRPTSEYTPPRPSSASPYGGVVQETVLNPEGRRLAGSSDSAFGSGTAFSDASPVDSQLWKRLFPVETDPTGEHFDAPAGCELGHFSIEERIGAGGMGAVFRALDQRLQRVVALKVLSPAQSRDRAAVMRFQNEARSAARLDHENVARVFFVGEDRGLHFIAFEYVTGQNVRDLIVRTGRMSVADAINFTLQIAAALRHTAAAGVVHRDIKPSNIIIAPNGRAKLVDLGLARKLAADSMGDLTVAGTTLGTFDYISPEQARDPRNVDVRSDIYSLGCTLYHMLTGGPPYSSGTVLQKLLDHQSGQAPDPRAVNPQVPPALSALCRKMMAGDPKNRPSTPDDLIRELAIIAASLGLRPMPPEGFVWSRPTTVASPKIRSGLIWAGSAVVVLLLALLVDRPSGVEKSPESAANSLVQNAGNSQSAAILPDRRDVAGATEGSRTIPPPPPQSEPEPAEPAERSARTVADATSAKSSPPTANQGGTTTPVVAPSNRSGTNTASSTTASGESSPAQRTAATGTADAWLDWLSGGINRFTGGSSSDVPVAESTAQQPEPVGLPSSDVSPDPPLLVGETESDLPPSDEPGLPFVLRLGNGDGEIKAFATLADAVSSAGSGDTIELHYNGVQPGQTPSEPFTIDGKTITIRAGHDEQQRLYRPVIEFVADPAVAKRSRMIQVSGERGGLILEGIELKMTVTDEARSSSGQWSLFAVFETQQVQLVGVGITVVNAKGWPGVSVFDLRQPDGLPAQYAAMDGFMDEGRSEGFAIDLQGCFVRGGADFMTVAHTRPGRVSLRESAFALQSALLNVSGSIELPLAGDALKLEMEHVTVVVGDALLRFEIGTLPHYATKVQATVRDSVLASSSAGPLVLMKGNATPTTFLEMLEWNGNKNVFDRFSEFWSILTDEGSSDLAPHKFEMWQEHWQQYASSGGNSTPEEAISPADDFTSIWNNAWQAKKSNTHEIIATDLELDRSDENLVATDALKRGANGRSWLVGAAVNELPRLSEARVGLSSSAPASPR